MSPGVILALLLLGWLATGLFVGLVLAGIGRLDRRDEEAIAVLREACRDRDEMRVGP